MSITLANMKTAIGRQYKPILTIHDDQGTEAIQYTLDEIVDDLTDLRELKTETSWLSCTQYQSYVDISSATSAMFANRIEQVVLKDTANDTDNTVLDYIDYETQYLEFLEDVANPDSEHYGDPCKYARRGDNLYLMEVPDKTTYQIKIYFGKAHPAVSSEQDILFPSDWKNVIFHGALAYLYSFVERKDGLMEKHKSEFERLKAKKISAYKHKPDDMRGMRCNWL